MSPTCSPVCSGVRKAVVCALLLSDLCSCFRDYHIVQEGRTWHEAHSYCMKRYTSLASVENVEDMARLTAAAGSGFSGTVWIGLHDVWDWRWSLGHDKLRYSSWRKGEPNNRKQQASCVYYEDGEWADTVCNTQLMFVCLNVTGTDWSYVFREDVLPWNEAKDYCRGTYTDLATVRNQTDNDMVRQVMPTNYTVWIGLYRHTWRWTYGESNFRSWADGHPQDSASENCVSMVVDQGTWVEKQCGTKMFFMCQNTKRQLYTVKLTALQSTIDLNDPRAKEAIMNWIREKFKERGLLRDVKVQWVKKPGKKIFYKEV